MEEIKIPYGEFKEDTVKTDNRRRDENSWRGYKNHANGALFERVVSDTLDIYRKYGIANIHKFSEPLKVIKRMGNGTFLCCFTKRSEPDFIGTLNGGKAIVFEAKHTDSDRIMQDVVKEHQAVALDIHESLGADCYVLVSIQLYNIFFVPWNVWKNMKENYGRKYATAEDLKEYGVVHAGGSIDFLGKLVDIK